MTTNEPEDDRPDAQEVAEQQSDYITPAVRREVLMRDNWRCRKCGEEETLKLTLHHVIFRSQLGSHTPDNLVTLCWKCHKLLHDGWLRVMRIGTQWFFSERNHYIKQHRSR